MLAPAAAIPARLIPKPLPPQLNPLLEAIAAAAPGSYLVGGAVRDLMLGRPITDIDIVVPSSPQIAARKLAEALDGSAFALDEARQQYRVTLRSGPVNDIDVSPIDGDLESDLRSRDYTINAMAAAIRDDGSLGDVIDPTGGKRDLEARTVRLIAVENLREDPLRLLRAARIATELDFEVEDATAGAIWAMASQLQVSAAERQRDEIVRILASAQAAAGVRLMDRLGLLSQVLPELEPARGVEQPGEHHYYDVFEHSMECLNVLDAIASPEHVDDGTGTIKMRAILDEGLEWYPIREYLDARVQTQKRYVLLKLAGLLHDVSKPETKTVEPSGKIRFLGHPEQGAIKTQDICRRLRFSNDEADFVALLVEEHLRPTMLTKPGEPPSRRALYRFFRDLGDAGPAVLLLMLADGAAAAGPRLTRESWIHRVRYVSYLLERYDGISQQEERAPRLVSGRDLMEGLDIEPGPLVGRLMRDVEEAIGAGEITTREDAIEYARTLLSGASEERQDG